MESLIDSSLNIFDEIVDTPAVLINPIDIKTRIKMDYKIFHTFLLVAIQIGVLHY